MSRRQGVSKDIHAVLDSDSTPSSGVTEMPLYAHGCLTIRVIRYWYPYVTLSLVFGTPSSHCQQGSLVSNSLATAPVFVPQLAPAASNTAKSHRGKSTRMSHSRMSTGTKLSLHNWDVRLTTLLVRS